MTHEIQPGQTVEVGRRFTQSDFDRFAALSGDDNPIHVDPEFAATTRFERTLCHGMLLFSTLSAVVGTELPGPGTRILDQALEFPGPTFAGDRCTVRVEVLSVRGAEARLSTEIRNEAGDLCCKGVAEVLLPEVRA